MMKRELPITPPSNLATRWRSLAASIDEGLGDAKAALGDPRVRAESRASLSHLTGASRRAREIGLAKAFEDKHVAKQLSRASRHASNALDTARGRRRRRNAWRRAFTTTVGAGLIAGSAYAAWKMQAKSGSPS